jgi:hypothetical protein
MFLRSEGWDMINSTITDWEVSGEDGWTILEVAPEHGIDLSTFHPHSAVEPSGACGLCMAEIHDGRRSRGVASCLSPIREGIKAATETDGSENLRRGVLQKLVEEYPGSKRLLVLAQTYGVTTPGFKSNDSEDPCRLLRPLCPDWPRRGRGRQFVLRQPGRESSSNHFCGAMFGFAVIPLFFCSFWVG